MTPRRWLLLALAAAAVLLLAGRALAEAYVDYRWYAAMGAEEVWRAKIAATMTLRLTSWIVATLFVFANLFAVRHSVVSVVLPRRVANLEIGEEVPGSYLTAIVIGVSVVLGMLLTMPPSDWSTFAGARSHIPFGESDPYLDVDLGFFVFWLPFETRIYTWTLISIFVVTALVLFLYALTPSLKWQRGTIYVSAYVRRHITVLAGVLLVMLAWSFRLDRFALLANGSGVDGAFSRVDHVLGLPGSLLLAVVTLGAAIVVIWSGWSGQIRLATGAIAGVLILSLLVRHVIPFTIARMDERDTKVRDAYEATRVGYTRRAYGVERLESADSANVFGSLADVARGVSAWDPQAIAIALERSRPVSVVGTEFGWHQAPTGLVADVPERLRAQNGWTLSRVLASSADEHGALARVGSAGIPTADETPIAPPIVFDSAGGYIVVSDSAHRIAGAPLDDTFERIAQAWSVQNPSLLFGDLPQPRPTIVAHRDLRERIGMIAPYFAQGTQITPIVQNDTITWIVDLYSASSTYPLSRHFPIAGETRAYFQHAATAVVNASTGRVRLVADSVLEPIAQTWVDRFSTVFTRWSAMSPSLRAALPPAADAVYAQAVAFGKYGTRSDSYVPRRVPPPADGADSVLIGVDPPFALPSGTLATAIPLIAEQGERVHGLVIGTGGVNRRTTWYGLEDAGPRWPNVLDRLRTGDAPSSGSTGREPPMIRGPVRAIPIAGDVAFLQSGYLWRIQGPPALGRVSLLFRDSVRSAPTLAPMAGSQLALRLTPLPIAPSDLRSRVDSLYKVMRESMRRGDWVAFGAAFDALGRLVGSGREGSTNR